MHAVAFDGSYEGWAARAREQLRLGCDPAGITWVDTSARAPESLWTEAVAEPAPATASSPPASIPAARVPKRFIELAKDVGCHAAPERWDALYRVLWRLTHGEPHLLEDATDADVRALEAYAKAVAREVHKMRAFVRFREVQSEDGPWFVAWFEPEHRVVARNAAFFRDRFASMRWSILTPDQCLHWDGAEVRVTAGVERSQAPAGDAVEDLWRTYYGSIFNPARVKERTMAAQMARRYWKNLPEAQDIPKLLAQAPARVDAMHELANAQKPTEEFQPYAVPGTQSLATLAEAAQSCRGCPLWKNATCAVFGEGPKRARVLVVGEQPGDQEDRAGKPFVGPAGQLLNRALEAAGLDRSGLYVTNAVKHFKWTPRGKRRLHAKPSAREAAACRPWLEAEVRLVKPDVIVCLGATAAQTVCGGGVKVTEQRGRTLPTEWGVPALLTVHPSSLLRLPPGSDREAEFDRFVADLRLAAD
jgi:DNA polymerase